jgi:hypothetical protein
LVPRVFASLISLFGTFCSTVALPAFNWGRLSKEMDPTRAAGNFCILAKFVPLSLPSGAATVDVMVLGAGLLQVGPEVHAAITIFCSFQQRRRTRNRRPFFGRRLFCSSFLPSGAATVDVMATASRTRSPRSNYYFLLISATKAYAKQATIFRAQTIL